MIEIPIAAIVVGGGLAAIILACWIADLYQRVDAQTTKAKYRGQRIADLMALHPEVAKVFEYTNNYSGYDRTIRVGSIGLTINLSLIERLGEAKRSSLEVEKKSTLLANYYNEIKGR